VAGSLRVVVDGVPHLYERRPYSRTSLETTNADGSISLDMFLGDTLAAGQHTFELQFIDQNGALASASMTRTFLPIPKIGYRVRLLDDSPLGEATAADIDNAGNVAGWIIRPDSSTVAAVWRSDGLTLLPTDPNTSTRALAIAGAFVVGRRDTGSK